MSRAATIANLVANCRSLTAAELAKLSDSQLNELDAVDTNWCYDDERRESGLPGASVEEAVSAAIFAQYEELVR